MQTSLDHVGALINSHLNLEILNICKVSLKFIYSEKATQFCEMCTAVKSKGKISQNLVAFSEYMNFNFENPDESTVSTP